jgi:branched-chain amino acid transport system permease protein
LAIKSPIRTRWLVGIAVLLVVALIPVAALPLPLPKQFFIVIPTEVFIFAVFALTYDVIFGYTGLISFGHALFVGAGAYGLTVAMSQHGAPLWLGLLVAVGVGVVFSTVTGALALRTRGVYFAMVTLALAQVAFTLADSNAGGLTGGANGEPVQGVPTWLVAPGNESHLYYVALIFLALSFLLLRLFVSSPAGRVWQAIRDNEQRALLIGYRPYVYKLLSYAIAGTLCSLAGAMYAIYVGYVSTDFFSASLTIQLLLMVIIGGAGSLWGAILGAAILRYLNYYLAQFATSSALSHFPSWIQQTVGQPLLILGVFYLLLIYFFPQGIAGLASRHLSFARTSTPVVGLGEIDLVVDEPVVGAPTPPDPVDISGGG